MVLSIPFVYFLVLANITSGSELAAPGRGWWQEGTGEGCSILGAGLREPGSAGRHSVQRDWRAADLLQSGCAACR